jgi:GH15 family glucan-1,4-alpha-glucosidase
MSKVWFTVADGVLSDVYFPTNDTTENETLQYVVTDGATFTDLQTRDMTYTVTALDDRALTCRVTATAKSGRYRIVTDYLTDPGRPTALLRSRFEALRGRLRLPRLRPLRPDAQRQRRGRQQPRRRPPEQRRRRQR